MPHLLQRWLPLAVLFAFAFHLRMWDVGYRPMHADEANQAVKAGQLLEGQGYAFDPADHHGPTLYYAVLPVAWLRGEHTLAQLTETTVRLVPAIAGTVAVLLLFALARPLGHWPALAAGAFLAVSPPAVYYSRFFIQETLLLAFTLGALLGGMQWWRTGRLGWAIAAGVCAGLMQATKASAPFFLAAAVIGLAVLRPTRPVSSRLGRDCALTLVAALFVAALFYSSFGTNLRGLGDAWSTYASFARRLGGETGHEKPWWYYLSLFGWHKSGGVFLHQIPFSLLALSGLVLTLRPGAPPLLRAAAGYTSVLFLGLSLVAYKTPWHAIHFVPGLALLAAGAVAALPRRPWTPTVLALVALCIQSHQVAEATIQRPSDDRNPYAYVHTSPDIRRGHHLARLAAAEFPQQPIRIISEEVWPLPWYFRQMPNVGYWHTVPDDCDGSLVIASAGLAEQVQAKLKDNYTSSFVGLRPGFTLVVFKRQP